MSIRRVVRNGSPPFSSFPDYASPRQKGDWCEKLARDELIRVRAKVVSPTEQPRLRGQVALFASPFTGYVCLSSRARSAVSSLPARRRDAHAFEREPHGRSGTSNSGFRYVRVTDRPSYRFFHRR